MSVLGTASPDPSGFHFNQRTGPAVTILYDRPFSISTPSLRNGLRGIITLAGTLCPTAFPLPLKSGVRCRKFVPAKLRNINRIPFLLTRLRFALGPTNPSLIDIEKEPLSSKADMVLTYLLLLLARRLSLPAGSQVLSHLLRPNRYACLPVPYLSEPKGIGTWFYSRPFSRRQPSTNALLRVHYRVAASKPT